MLMTAFHPLQTVRFLPVANIADTARNAVGCYGVLQVCNPRRLSCGVDDSMAAGAVGALMAVTGLVSATALALFSW